MRLRSRRRAALPGDWVQPSGAGRFTTVGTLDAEVTAAVDPAGLVAVDGSTWSLDWWIGAEDRWHVPSREVAVRQTLLDSTPVVETRLRVPSGDAVHRVYGARSASGNDALVVEVHNDSKVPFAVALAVRPYGLDGTGEIGSIELEGNQVSVDGELALVLPRSPGRIALRTADEGDAADLVFDGSAGPVGPASTACDSRLATAALLFPLAHTATLRVVLPLRSDSTSRTAGPDAFPSAGEVAAGWEAQRRQGARFEVPNRSLREAITASVHYLRLALRSGDPVVARSLDLAGFADDAARLLLEDPPALAIADHPGVALDAVGVHWSLTHDVTVAEACVPLVAAIVPALARSTEEDATMGRAALGRVADMLEAVGEGAGARDARSIATIRAGEGASGVQTEIEALLGSAGSTWSAGPGHDVSANARLVSAVRALLVQEIDGGVALSPEVPEAWLGQGWEVHDAPTAHGRLSYAIRWHGERPALLWELRPHEVGSVAVPVTLTVPGLDPAWVSREPSGEALLAPVVVPERPSGRRGISIPVAIEPMPRGER